MCVYIVHCWFSIVNCMYSKFPYRVKLQETFQRKPAEKPAEPVDPVESIEPMETVEPVDTAIATTDTNTLDCTANLVFQLPNMFCVLLGSTI